MAILGILLAAALVAPPLFLILVVIIVTVDVDVAAVAAVVV